MTKGRVRSEQSKTASLGTNTSPHRGSRGSCGDGGIDDGAVSGASVQTPFGGQKAGVFGGASGGGGGMTRGEASTSGMQIPNMGSAVPRSARRVERREQAHISKPVRHGSVGLTGWLLF